MIVAYTNHIGTVSRQYAFAYGCQGMVFGRMPPDIASTGTDVLALYSLKGTWNLRIIPRLSSFYITLYAIMKFRTSIFLCQIYINLERHRGESLRIDLVLQLKLSL
ncbi:hypothetical protein Bhyg_02077 [Pseudolycoriella hygida]|uniref:Uncharacterized protein n=1 Tax=Pseudolycoriella hygida TaxID=35572 RepID=A0A9Q0NAQ4_9DIPT|nr:hypothetical protein Bhyg_02077 [Pseudolycoriella hygida]